MFRNALRTVAVFTLVAGPAYGQANLHRSAQHDFRIVPVIHGLMNP